MSNSTGPTIRWMVFILVVIPIAICLSILGGEAQ